MECVRALAVPDVTTDVCKAAVDHVAL